MLDAFRIEMMSTQESLQNEQVMLKKQVDAEFESQKEQRAAAKQKKPAINEAVSSKFESHESQLREAASD